MFRITLLHTIAVFGNRIRRQRMRNIRIFKRYLQTFLLGGFAYGLIELLWRGRTHPSMVLTGGCVMILFIKMNRVCRSLSLPLRCLFGSIIITFFELAVGCTVNLGLGMKVWDYSSMPFHILGQICPLYSFLWFLLCFPVFALCPVLERTVFNR